MAKACSKCGIKKPLEEFHIAKRYKDGRRSCCKTCRSNLELVNYQHKKEHYRANKNTYIDKAIKYYQNNKELRLDQIKSRYKQIRGTLDFKNKRKCSAAKRRVDQLKRTPKWADLDKIKQIYADCPEGYHVDHIIPLNGKIISGLHVPQNLQYLSPNENCKKSNKFEVTCG